MLGPGMGELVSRMCLDELSKDDLRVLKSFDPLRDFSAEEVFK